MDRAGSPHTEKLKFTSASSVPTTTPCVTKLPSTTPAHTAPWTNTFQMRWNAGPELFEYVCQDNNFAPELLVGQEEKVDRTSTIIP